MSDKETIQILSENPIEQIWLYLSRLESVPLARRTLQTRADRSGRTIDADLLDRKAIGVAYALRSARDYLQQPGTSDTKRVVSTYYGTMSLMSAAIIGDPTSKYDLEGLEDATKFGHGLGSVDDASGPFPKAQKVYVTNDGFALRYLKHLGADASGMKFAKRVKQVDDLTEADRSKLVSLDDLLARVPELANFYYDVTGRAPLSAHAFSSDRNSHLGLEAAKRSVIGRSNSSDEEDQDLFQWVGLRVPGVEPEGDPLRVSDHLGISLTDMAVETDMVTDERYWVGRVPEGGKHWHEALSLYHSPMCPTSWFRPLFGAVQDPLFLHFVTLYELSIIARYRPKLWREVTEGDLTEYLALLRYYLAVVDRVLPETALGLITGCRIRSVQPGSFFAPL